MLTVKPTGKRRLGKPRQRRENNIRKDLEEMVVNTRKWVDSAQDYGLLESPCECGIKPPGFINHGVSSLTDGIRAAERNAKGILNSCKNMGSANKQEEIKYTKSVIRVW